MQPKEESASSPFTTVAALEEALSEGTTEVEGGVIVYEKLHLPLPEDLEVGGWTHLCDNIVNYITRRIHNNPDFFPTLALQFEGQDTIFREDQRALEGLHIVCRWLERDTVEHIAWVEADQVGNAWEEYIDNAQRRGDILGIYDMILQNRN